jgi:hypothetical protein
LLFGMTAFGFIQLSAALLVTRLMPWLRQPDYAQRVQRLKALQTRQPRRALTVVALGTSRTMAGLDGALAESLLEDTLGQPVTVCNFGTPGSRSFTHLQILRRLLADGHRPDFLVLELFPVTLHRNFPLDTTDDFVSTVSERYSELDSLEHYSKERAVSRIEWGLQWLSPLYTYRKNIMSYLLPNWLPLAQRLILTPCDAWGRSPVTASENLRSSTRAQGLAFAKTLYAEAAKDLDLGGEPLELLTTLLQLCQRERIPTAMVMMPEGPMFRSWYGPGRIDRCRTLLKDLSHRFDIPLIDALLWVDDENDYGDSHHLAAGGSRKYTLRLFGEALPPLLKHSPGSNGGRVDFANNRQE